MFVFLTYEQLWRQCFLGETEQFCPIYVVGPEFVDQSPEALLRQPLWHILLRPIGDQQLRSARWGSPWEIESKAGWSSPWQLQRLLKNGQILSAQDSLGILLTNYWLGACGLHGLCNDINKCLEVSSTFPLTPDETKWWKGACMLQTKIQDQTWTWHLLINTWPFLIMPKNYLLCTQCMRSGVSIAYFYRYPMLHSQAYFLPTYHHLM